MALNVSALVRMDCRRQSLWTKVVGVSTLVPCFGVSPYGLVGVSTRPRLGRETWPADLAGRLGRQTCFIKDGLKMAKKIESQHCFI
jgi:hypothetical protein